jgi:hypothetical protein
MKRFEELRNHSKYLFGRVPELSGAHWRPPSASAPSNKRKKEGIASTAGTGAESVDNTEKGLQNS